MKDINKSFWNKHGLIFITLLTFIVTAIVNFNVRLYGDDFFYACFTRIDFDYFITRHLDHYMRANGRAIVHLFVTVFLGINQYFWAICNSLMLAGIVFFGAKICMGMEVKEKKSLIGYSAVIMAVTIFFLDPNLTRQSVYWLTGSFNYVYPIFMLLVYWYLLSRSTYSNKMRWYVPIIGFLAAATVEQASVMTFGLTLLMLLEKRIIRKNKINKMEILTLIIVALGMLSVICSPAVFLRASIEDSPVEGFLPLIKHNLIKQGDYFMFSKIMLPYHMLAIVASFGVIGKYGKSISDKYRWTKNLAVILGVSACIGLLLQTLTGKVLNYYGMLGRFGIEAFIGLGYLYTLIYAGILIYKNKFITNNALPIIAVILGFGAQFMMIISPVFGPRNLVYPIFMLALYSACIIPRLNKFGISAICGCLSCIVFNLPWLLPIPITAYMLVTANKGKYNKVKYKKLGIATGYLTVALVSLTILIPTIKGYADNAVVYDKNIQEAKKFIEENKEGPIYQKKLPKETYGWVMPYHNSYYSSYYDLYLGFDKDYEVNWLE
ncbi:DUF6056 family protein [Vallitalea guaymasensis]|uniref:DUF6056 family protein n=1 Tax=Vallitalea guaymasensis TaxID=1185412 RepID=UPI000DE3F9D3|nr:DUF6056 family protein [Vallitalea guaymasensis]